jgi:hypothetical protein
MIQHVRANHVATLKKLEEIQVKQLSLNLFRVKALSISKAKNLAGVS